MAKRVRLAVRQPQGWLNTWFPIDMSLSGRTGAHKRAKCRKKGGK